MDRYTITARVYPMILFYMPLSVFVIVSIWDFEQYYHYSVPVGAMGVMAYLTSHLGRDAGKTKESRLWKDWGGAPTTQLFRWSDNRIDPYTKKRNHDKMHHLCPSGNPFDPVYESQNPVEADSAYRSWTIFLLGKTRDISVYPLIFKENMAYGFRRNLWGLKPYAMMLISLLMGLTYLYFAVKNGHTNFLNFPEVFIFAETYLSLFMLFWILRVTRTWVSLPAFAYAERVHESIQTL